MEISVRDLDINFQLSLFAAMMEGAGSLVAAREKDSGKLIYINKRGQEMLGSNDPVELEKSMNENHFGKGSSLVTGNKSSRECEWVNREGKTQIAAYSEILFKHDGKEYCFFSLSPFLSYNSYQQQIATQLERFSALFDYASIGILVANQQGKIIMINNYALLQFGYEREELLDCQVEQLLPKRFHSKHVAHRENYNAHPQNRPMGIGMDLFASHKDGSEFPVEISLSHYTNEEGAFVIAYINNITERKKAEERVEKLNSELEQMVSQRTEQLTKALSQLELSKEELTTALGKERELGELKSRFVSMASHEFRTPLSTILSSAFLVKQYSAEEDQSKRNKHLQRIVSSVNMLTDILNDFLSVGKIEEGKIQVRHIDFDIKEHITEVIQEIQGIIKEGQQVNYEHTGNPIMILDPTLLKHIIMNLLGNAIKFSSTGSTIYLRSYQDNDHYKVVVSDTGIGMSREDQQHLFERFFRGANANNIQGTGLGLHIVNKYTELMNGSISCESDLGVGTTFTVTFPIDNNINHNTNENDPPDRRQ